MRLRVELTIGPFYFAFDPWPDEEAEDDEPQIRAVTAVEVNAERRDDYGNPGLHMGFRGGYFEE